MGPLLETKFHVPRRRPHHVARPRLRELLDQGADAALTVVSAPAGFGKSTLLADWTAGSTREGRAAAWLALDDRDNDPALFWTYVISAIQRSAPQVGDGALSMLSSSSASFDAIVASLLNDLHASSGEVALALDDYHAIETPVIHESLTYLVEHLPPGTRLLLATRFDPPLPLARLRARGELLEIRAAQLRFTHGEVAAYLDDAVELGLDGHDVAALADHTEGWIAALQLAALSLQGRDDPSSFIANFAGDDRYVVDYLVGEVLQQQPANVRDFLLATSILRRMNGPLCEAVTARGAGRDTLALLEQANLFTVALDDRRDWYRYHHLFAEMLRTRLLDEHPERVPELHARASGWYERRGDLPEAIHHALEGADAGRAADLIEAAAYPLRRARQEATLLSWLEALPEEVFADRPVLNVVMVGVSVASGAFDDVEARLTAAERWLTVPATDRAGSDETATAPVVIDEAEFRRLPSQIAIYRAAHALVRGEHTATIAHALEARDLAAEDDHLGQGAASGLLGLAHWASGDLVRAHDHYEHAAASLERAGHLSDVLGCTLASGDILVAQGKLGAARDTYERGLDLVTAHDPVVRGTADLHVGIAEVLIERDDRAGAAHHLTISASLGDRAHLPQQPYRWLVTTARIRRAEGDLTGSIELLDEAERVHDSDMSPNARPVAAIRAQVLLAQGDVDGALRWAAARQLSIDEELSYVREFEHVTYARVLLAQHASRRDEGPLGDALRLLDRLLRAAEDGRRTGSVIEILTLQARAQRAAGDEAAARTALERALVLAEPEEHVRVFRDEGVALASLLRAAADRAGPRSHARRVVAALGGARSVPPVTATNGSGASDALVEPLSDRELDVLKLLRTPLSGPDIARELHVSLNTFRTHTRRIYLKLGASGRRSAVTRADELGI